MAAIVRARPASGGQSLSVEDAISMKELDKGALFTCIGCGQPIRPHKASRCGRQPAHFEHYKGAEPCSYKSPVKRVAESSFSSNHR
ncbi:hypothetical protein BCU75_23680 [Vibrio splendidus]|nr:hypothetical protein BCU75_23680 [Vibrio splendidus]